MYKLMVVEIIPNKDYEPILHWQQNRLDSPPMEFERPVLTVILTDEEYKTIKRAVIEVK